MKRIAVYVAQGIQALLDIIAAILGAYYAKKYAAIAKRLGLPRIASSGQRGFIIVQVDGLAHTYLNQALDLGYAPYIQRLLRRGEFTLQHWRTGLPCTTPAGQAGIMFGNNDDIPAFRWYDKVTGDAIVCKVPSMVKAIQDRVSAGHPGILSGGSSIMNMFDGDASLSMFTLGAMNTKRFFESVRGMGFLLLFLLNPFRTLKTAILSLWEYVADFAQRTWATVRRQTPRPLDRAFPFLRVLSNVILREIQTFAVMVDIYRGVPAIYTTYYGYDELAHNFGPLSKPALRALRAIDARVHQIDSFRRLALTREYDLFLLSDHGMTPAIPFHRTYKKTLGQLIRDLAGEVELSEEWSAGPLEAQRMIYLAEELLAIEANVKPPLARIPRKIRRLVTERIARSREAETPPFDLSQRTNVVVRSSGSLSHIYFNVSPKQMNISEIALFFPNLISELAAQEGIWLVIGREGEQIVVMSREGILSLDGKYHVEGKDPLSIVPSPRAAASQLRRLAGFPHSGDLILMGSYDPQANVVYSFEEQWGCHGGLGGPQGMAFMLMNRPIDWGLEHVGQSTQLYPLFARRYHII